MVTTARDYHDLDFIIRATDLSGISTYISFIKYQHFLLVFNRLRFSVSGEILKQRHFLLRRKEGFSFGLVWVQIGSEKVSFLTDSTDCFSPDQH